MDGWMDGIHRLNMSETISTSVRAASIFSDEVSCGLALPKRKAMAGYLYLLALCFSFFFLRAGVEKERRGRES